ncbi:MAG: esterase-like activity of phytase family protein [Paracoccaceae bacterium]
MRRRTRLSIAASLLLVTGLQGAASPWHPANFLSAYRWSGDDPRLGGLSGIEVSADGREFIALSDRGAITRGRFDRDADGRIAGIDTAPFALLKAGAEAPLDPARADSEGLAWGADGRILVSFEGVARVLAYDRVDGSAGNLPRHPDFAAMQANSALEALAIDARGRIFTLPERSGDEDRPFPVYMFDGSWHQDWSIPRDGAYLPVGADFGPDGRLYLLERRFLGIGGFASRVRAFALDQHGFGAGQTVLETTPGTHGNLEGLSVWLDDRGDIRLTMLSDDNFLFYLRNEIVEYRLPVDAADPAG